MRRHALTWLVSFIREHGSRTPASGQEARLASRLFDVAARWISHPDSIALQESLASLLTDGEPDPIEQEFHALHLAVLAVGVAALGWPFERRKAVIKALAKEMGALVGPGTDQDPEEWARFYQGRISHYEWAVPWDTDATDEDLVAIGGVFVKGVSAHPKAPRREVPSEDVRLEMGKYFWLRLTQLTEVLFSWEPGQP